MRKKSMLIVLTLLILLVQNSQEQILKPAFLKFEIDSTIRDRILTATDSLFSGILEDKIDSSVLDKENQALTIDFLESLPGLENNRKDSIKGFYKKQLINLYKVAPDTYILTLAYLGSKINEQPVLRAIINLLVIKQGEKILFSTPIKYLTQNYKRKLVGNTSFIFIDSINLTRAEIFDRKNTLIAQKLGLKVEKITIYMCNNYQDVLYLLGYEYLQNANGTINNGYGPTDNTVLTVMHNEDFSHDLFHSYTGKLRGSIKFNPIVEEGIAYSWANAFYAKANGDMIYQEELVQDLKKYLKENPQTSLLEMFNKNPAIFTDLPVKVKVRSVIASLLCDEVEKQKGNEGIRTLIKCGPGEDDFFNSLNQLIGINKVNFDMETGKLLANYGRRE
jgi:hypothetical protein